MTHKQSKLAIYLNDQNFQTAVQYHLKHKDLIRLSEQKQNTILLLAKAYYSMGMYKQSISFSQKLKSSPNLSNAYEASLLQYKAYVLIGILKKQILKQIKDRLQKQQPIEHKKYLVAINEIIQIESKIESSKSVKNTSSNEYKQFCNLKKSQEQYFHLMQGMPSFLLSQQWFQKWKKYTHCEFSSDQGVHPGPITNFEILDHIYNYYHDYSPSKEYTNKYLFNNAKYIILTKKCWIFLKQKYGGIDIRRYNITSLEKPNQIFAQIFMKKIQIAKYSSKMIGAPLKYVMVQITRKQSWQGLKKKLFVQWGQGKIKVFQKNMHVNIDNNASFQDIDTASKLYHYVTDEMKKQEKKQIQKPKQWQCGNRSCKKTNKLQFCQCKTIKYCDLQCLKADWKYHKSKCLLQTQHLKLKPVTFKQFNLSEKDYGGRKGVVGLRNLGNTCYMNSGLQCLSNTKEITQYFMSDSFKADINTSNPLGTKGYLACTYAQLIRQMWTGNEQVISPHKLKKKIGQFATQFSGFGQQDSQQFISYLIDGLQQDLNLVKKKEAFQTKDEIKPDQQMSKQSELNYSKRIQSYIRNLMVGQYKSTVVCSTCQKISVCFDPFLLLSVNIPSKKQTCFYFIPAALDKSAIKFQFYYNQKLSFQNLKNDFIRKFNDFYDREIQRNKRQSIQSSRLLFFTMNSQSFKISRFLKESDMITEINSENIIFCLQVPKISQNQQLYLAQYLLKGQYIGYPRLIKVSKKNRNSQLQQLCYQSIQRNNEKSSKIISQSVIENIKQIKQDKQKLFKNIVVELKEKLPLLKYTDSYSIGFRTKIVDLDDEPITLSDCLKAFTQNWYCNRCKDFKQATKQMQVYKSNKILVVAFKRFSRNSKITSIIKYPIQKFNMGPFLLSNKTQENIYYDLYGVVNHYGSLYGGHYTAYCKNFLTQQWFEFNDSRVSSLDQSQIISNSSYVLFYRRRD